MRSFIEQFTDSLRNELDPLLSEGIYLDEERLNAGEHYNPAIANELCNSACMVMIYVPTYEQSSYCMREFTGMVRLERERNIKLRNGVHPKIVQERLGHANISTTLNTYSHVTEGMQAEAAEEIANLILPAKQ